MSTHTHSSWPTRLRARFSDVISITCLGLFCGFAYVSYPHLVGVQDIGIYRNIALRADDLFHGIPNDVRAEYPPLATLLFWLAHTVAWHDFAAAWIAIVAVSCALTWTYLRCIEQRTALAFAILLPMMTLMMGREMIFGRFDVFVMLPLLLSIVAYRRDRVAESGFFLMLAVCVKIIPFIGFPFLMAAVPRKRWKEIVIGVLSAALIAALLSVLVLGWEGVIGNVTYMLTYHGDRGLQIESTWSSILLLFASGLIQSLPTGMSHMSVVNLGTGSDVMAACATYVVLGGLGMLFLWSVVRKKSVAFPTLFVCSLLWSLFATPVLSPQYLVWVVPIILFWLIEHMLRGECHPAFGVTVILTICVAALTQWIFAYHYQDLIQQSPLAVHLLMIRNVSLLGLFFAFGALSGLFAQPLRQFSHVGMRGMLQNLSLDSLFLLVAAFLYFGIRPGMVPHITKVAYLARGELHAAAPSLPFVMTDETLGIFDVQTDFLITPSSNTRYWRIRQDDCLERLNINGMWLPDALTGFCEGDGPGRVFDLGAYIHPGVNNVLAVVRNTGGPAGFDLVPVRGPLLIAIVLIFWLTVAWYAVQMLHLLPVFHDLAVRTVDCIGYTLQRLWTRLHSRTRRSSPASENQQMALSI